MLQTVYYLECVCVLVSKINSKSLPIYTIASQRPVSGADAGFWRGGGSDMNN